jgi:hypothetical protein
MRYGIVLLLFALAVFVKQYISPVPTSHTHGYLATSQRTDTLARYCVDKDVCSFMPFQYARSNRLRLQAIQYIGTDIYAAYHPELYARLTDITTLDTQRSYPYIFGQHLLPQEDNAGAIQEAVALGERWLNAVCDREKIESIAQLSDEVFLDMYYHYDKVVPCDSYLLPKSLGFVLFYYAKDIPRAIMYYRVAALAYDAPDTLVNMPAIITARYDDDRKSMMMWESRYQSAQYQLNPELNDTDLFFLLSTMEHALRKAVHHMFVSLIEETATSNNCDILIDCVQKNISATITTYINQCNNEDQVVQKICMLLSYAQEQWWITRQGKFMYPLDPSTSDYGRREDLQRWDIIPQ